MERFTSEVKSMCPGVSIILKRTFCGGIGSHVGRVPETRDSSRGNSDAALALLFHPVGDGVAFVHFADFVALAGVVEDALGRGRFTRVDVRDDAEVSDFF
jgi:hypothetical protein